MHHNSILAKMDIQVDLMNDFQLPFDSPEQREAIVPIHDNQVIFILYYFIHL